MHLPPGRAVWRRAPTAATADAHRPASAFPGPARPPQMRERQQTWPQPPAEHQAHWCFAAELERSRDLTSWNFTVQLATTFQAKVENYASQRQIWTTLMRDAVHKRCRTGLQQSAELQGHSKAIFTAKYR